MSERSEQRSAQRSTRGSGGRERSDADAKRGGQRHGDGRQRGELHIYRISERDVHDCSESRRFYVYAQQPEYDGQRGQRCGNELHSEWSDRSADDHDTASESDGGGRADSNVHSGGGRNRTIELPMAEERGEHHGSDFSELHNADNDDGG